MNFDEVRAQVTAWINDGLIAWNAAHPAEQKLALDTENRELIQQGAVGQYLDLAVVPFSSEQMELAAHNVLIGSWGQVQLSIAVRENTGVQLANTARDFLIPYIERKSVPGLQTYVFEEKPRVDGKNGWVYFPAIVNYRSFRFSP